MYCNDNAWEGQAEEESFSKVLQGPTSQWETVKILTAIPLEGRLVQNGGGGGERREKKKEKKLKRKKKKKRNGGALTSSKLYFLFFLRAKLRE